MQTINLPPQAALSIIAMSPRFGPISCAGSPSPGKDMPTPVAPDAPTNKKPAKKTSKKK